MFNPTTMDIPLSSLRPLHRPLVHPMKKMERLATKPRIRERTFHTKKATWARKTKKMTAATTMMTTKTYRLDL